jgi:type II secretory pathway pseudopilin PulG
MQRRSKLRKYAVELIVILSIVAILAAIAIPNLLTAMNRSHQKRSMADLRTLATAIEAYATDRNSYSVDSNRGPIHVAVPISANEPIVLDLGTFHRVPFVDLERALIPMYIKTLPKKDGWGNEFEVYVGEYDAKGEAQSYVLRMAGRDGVFQKRPYVLATAVTGFDEDLVLSLGNFIQYPEGTCSG